MLLTASWQHVPQPFAAGGSGADVPFLALEELFSAAGKGHFLAHLSLALLKTCVLSSEGCLGNQSAKAQIPRDEL